MSKMEVRSSERSDDQPLRIGMVVPSNMKGGAQKIAAMAACDLARAGHAVSIFVPVLPYSYYFVELRGEPLLWMRVAATYASDWLRHRRFAFHEIVDPVKGRVRDESGGLLRVQWVARYVPQAELARLDYLVVFTIAQVAEYRDRFPQERQVYHMLHTEEREHGHADILRGVRRNFRGKIVAISPFTSRLVQEDVPGVSVVPVAVSPLFWAQRRVFDVERTRYDLLFHHRAARGGSEALEIVRALQRLRPQTSLTIWCRDGGTEIAREFPDAAVIGECTEAELCELYLQHSLLLFPSTFEGFGMPPVEASACGCVPILQPHVGAAELYTRDGENSIHLGEDAAVVAARIAEMLDDPKRLQVMRHAAAQGLELFNPDGYGRRIFRAAGFIPDDGGSREGRVQRDSERLVPTVRGSLDV